jgi:hypothetical protein
MVAPTCHPSSQLYGKCKQEDYLGQPGQNHENLFDTY